MTRSIATFLTITLLLLGCSGKEEAPAFIDDQPALLTKHERERIIQLNRKLFEALDIHIKIVLLKESPLDINQKAVGLFKAYALGKKTRGAKGILFVVDPAGKQVRMEIGYDLEPIFPDGFVGYIERKQMVPFFQANKIGPGIEATIELLVGKGLGAIKESDYTWVQKKYLTDNELSGGGGARVDVEIGSGAPKKRPTPLPDAFGPQPSPQMALRKYKQILLLHIKDPNLEIFTPETRQFFKKWVVTDAQQDNELKQLEDMVARTTVLQRNNLAVIRFSVKNRQASPFFLQRNDEGWMLDFASMSRIIGFNHKNQWFFRMTNHRFMFGFEDVIFDKNGFPHKKRASSS
jgi:hypothetical protein